MHRYSRLISCSLLALFTALIGAGCSTLPRNPVPIEKMALAQVIGMPGIRASAGKVDPAFQRDIIESVREEPPGLFPRAPDGSIHYHALSISGGGANGAFSAGYLNGWTQSGKRPVFKLVTGISTGALIAPFAFAGSEFDERLKNYYTNIEDQDVYEVKPLLSALSSDSIADSGPLIRLIADSVNEDVIKRVAEAHNQGGRLYIGTANLDSDEFIVWNMGKIANSGHPKAVALFHKVMLASASIPILFPPVLIDVEVDGETYDEMHVDGGTKTQLFFYGAVLNLRDAGKHIPKKGSQEKIKGTLYIIRNGKLSADPKPTQRNLFQIAERSVSSIINSSSLGDYFRIRMFAVRDNIEVKYTGIPEDFEWVGKKKFDPGNMKRLYEIGYQMALSDSPWNQRMPGLD